MSSPASAWPPRPASEFAEPEKRAPPPAHSRQPWPPRPLGSCCSRPHPACSALSALSSAPVKLNSGVGPSETLRTTSRTPPSREGKETDWAEYRAAPPAAELQGLWAPPSRRSEALGLSRGLVRGTLAVAHARPAPAGSTLVSQQTPASQQAGGPRPNQVTWGSK